MFLCSAVLSLQRIFLNICANCLKAAQQFPYSALFFIISLILITHYTFIYRLSTSLEYSCLENPMDRGAWKATVPWGRWGSDTTEWLHFYFSFSCIGEGNENPLQCSCLENPRDGRAWRAAVYEVSQSRTWLKRLSSSSMYRCESWTIKKSEHWGIDALWYWRRLLRVP